MKCAAMWIFAVVVLMVVETRFSTAPVDGFPHVVVDGFLKEFGVAESGDDCYVLST